MIVKNKMKSSNTKALENLGRLAGKDFYIYGNGSTARHLRRLFHENEGFRRFVENDEQLLEIPFASTVVIASSFHQEVYERIRERVREKEFDLWYYPKPEFELGFPDETYCVIPFVQSTISQNGNACLCCVSEEYALKDESGKPMNLRNYSLEQIWSSPAINDIREKMLFGKRVANCVGCYVSEKKYGASYRTTVNSDLKRFTTRVPFEKPKSMDLRIENLCNLRCVICSPQWSSGIENDPVHKKWSEGPEIIRIPNRFGDNKKWQSDPRLIAEINRFGSNVEHLLLAGGEPFISTAMMGFVDFLVANHKASEVELTIYTNFTRFTKGIGEKLSQFKKIHLILSLDAADEVYEFVRYPARWGTIEEKLALLESLPELRLKVGVINVNISLSMFGAPFCEDIIDWCDRNSLKWFLGIVNGPAHVSPRCLPSRFKREISEKLSKYENHSVENFIKMMEETDSNSDMARKAQRDFLQFAEEIAKSRNLSLEPFAPLIEEIRAGINFS